MQQTLEYHWGKHHRAYVDNLNKQISGGELDSKNIEEIVKACWNDGKPNASFNNAAQTWSALALARFGACVHVSIERCSDRAVA